MGHRGFGGRIGRGKEPFRSVDGGRLSVTDLVERAYRGTARFGADVGGLVVESLKRRLLSEIVGEVRIDEPLKRYTTYRIGGPADVLVIPVVEEDVVRVLRACHQAEVPLRVIGSGSNLLVSEAGVRGVVMRLGPKLGAVEFSGTTVRAQGGTSLPKLAKLAADRGLAGLEWAGGVPGTVGGAVAMNAGAHGSDTSRVLMYADMVDRAGNRRRISAEEMGFAYRTNRQVTNGGHVVLAGAFQLTPDDREAIIRRMKSFAARRRRTQPLGVPSTGSVFKNPPGDHAGRLIEAAGLKGVAVGGAQVSTVHANFIVNLGNATAYDVRTLIDRVKSKVKALFDIDLELEVELVGWDDDDE